jgi:hypothetical protein
MHPANDGRIIQMSQSDLILLANNVHAGLFKFRQLRLCRPLPKANVSIETGSAVAFRIRGRLEPDGQWKKGRIGGRAARPFFWGGIFGTPGAADCHQGKQPATDEESVKQTAFAHRLGGTAHFSRKLTWRRLIAKQEGIRGRSESQERAEDGVAVSPPTSILQLPPVSLAQFKSASSD